MPVHSLDRSFRHGYNGLITKQSVTTALCLDLKASPRCGWLLSSLMRFVTNDLWTSEITRAIEMQRQLHRGTPLPAVVELHGAAPVTFRHDGLADADRPH
jgi:hypothetical protein